MRSDKGTKRKAYIPKIDPKYKSYLNKCNAMEVHMDLSEKEFKQALAQPCYYCGSSYWKCLTRIDLDKGYTIDNVRSCCYWCTLIKSRLTEEQFLQHVQRIAEHMTGHSY